MSKNENFDEISESDKIAGCIDLLVQKFPSIDQEFVRERLENADNLIKEFTEIFSEMNYQTVQDSVNQILPDYTRLYPDISGIGTFFDIFGGFKEVGSVDENDLQAQLERIKSILPETEFLYDLEVLINRLRTSTNIAMEANLLINEILNDESTRVQPANQAERSKQNISAGMSEILAERVDVEEIASASVNLDTPAFEGSSRKVSLLQENGSDLLKEQRNSVSSIKSEIPGIACRNKILKIPRPKLKTNKMYQRTKRHKKDKHSSSNRCRNRPAETSEDDDNESSVDGFSAAASTTLKSEGYESTNENVVRSILNINLACEKPEVPRRNKILPKNAVYSNAAKLDLSVKSVTAENRSVEDFLLTSIDDFEETNLAKENFVLSEEDENAFLSLYEMFPDIDPVFLAEIMIRQQMDVQDVVDRLTGEDYPKLRDRLYSEQKDRRRKVLLSKTFTQANLNEMLLIFNNDPKGYFSNIEKVVSDSYKKHVLVLATAEFPFNEIDISAILTKNNFHYYPSRIELINKYKEHGKESNFLHDSTSWKLKWPEEIDEGFFREVQFAMFENQIENELALKRAHRVNQVKHAIDNDLLLECGTCLDQERLETDMVFCDSCEHSFCRECVKNYANVQLGNGSQTVACMESTCESTYGIATLSDIVSPQLIDFYWRREKSNQSSNNRTKFDECPFCSFSVVAGNENDKIFKCFNPDCLKESCRICKSENHIPMPCPTVDSINNNETMIRNFIANQMAEAMIRICPNQICGNRIVKESGCNEMTCPCGQKMCYVCKQPIESAQDHFRTFLNENRCPQFSQLFEVNQMEAIRAGHDALKKFNKSEQETNRDNFINELVDEPNSDEDEPNEEAALMHLTVILELIRGRIQEQIEEHVDTLSATSSDSSSDVHSPSAETSQRRSQEIAASKKSSTAPKKKKRCSVM